MPVPHLHSTATRSDTQVRNQDDTPRRVSIHTGFLIKTWLIAILFSALQMASCGYAPEANVLPGGAYRLELAPVENLTSEADADVLLREKLRRKLHQRPSIRVVDAEEARVRLKVILDSASVNRSLSTDSSGVSRRLLVYTVRGRVTLNDRFDGRVIINNTQVSGSGQVWLPGGESEPPATRRGALDAALGDLADEVEHVLFTAF